MIKPQKGPARAPISHHEDVRANLGRFVSTRGSEYGSVRTVRFHIGSDVIGLRQRGISQQPHSEDGGTIFKIGDQVYARLGTMSVVGTVVSIDEDTGRVLVRFSAVQQDWYEPGEVRPFEP